VYADLAGRDSRTKKTLRMTDHEDRIPDLPNMKRSISASLFVEEVFSIAVIMSCGIRAYPIVGK
jgi:hypothetical protein